jgi:hypothetical protein
VSPLQHLPDTLQQRLSLWNRKACIGDLCKEESFVRRVQIPIIIVLVFVIMQLVPFGRKSPNPRVSGTPEWDSPRTEDLARRACFDCHSNETRWPWYASVAPVSWLVVHDVEEGRHELNFSAFDQPQENAGDAAKMVAKGEMPPWDYVMMHPESRLSKEEKTELMRGLDATFGPDLSETED